MGTRYFILGVLVGFQLAQQPWERGLARLVVLSGLARARHEEQKALSPQAALALKLKLSYEQVAAKPQDYLGKPVVWCIDHPDPKVSYVEGRPSQPVSWSNAQDVPRTSDRHCEKMLAVVESSGSLRYIGTP